MDQNLILCKCTYICKAWKTAQNGQIYTKVEHFRQNRPSEQCKMGKIVYKIAENYKIVNKIALNGQNCGQICTIGHKWKNGKNLPLDIHF